MGQMSFSNGDGVWTSREPYTSTKQYTLPGDNGIKTVSVRFQDNAGLTSPIYNCTVNLQVPQPTQTPKAQISPTPTAATPTSTPTPTASATPQVPEFTVQIILILLAASTLTVALASKKKIDSSSARMFSLEALI